MATIYIGEDVSDSEDEYNEYMRRHEDIDSDSDEDEIYVVGAKPGVKRYSTPKKDKKKNKLDTESYDSYEHYQQVHKAGGLGGGSSGNGTRVLKTPPSSRIVFTPQLLSTPQRLGQRRAVRKPVTPSGGVHGHGPKASEDERKAMLEEYQRLRR